jgi:hypothetical protein
MDKTSTPPALRPFDGERRQLDWDALFQVFDRADAMPEPPAKVKKPG